MTATAHLHLHALDEGVRYQTESNRIVPAGSGGVTGAPAFTTLPGAGARTVPPVHSRGIYAVSEA